MSYDDITQRAISHSLTLNNFQAKTKPVYPQFRRVRETLRLTDLALFFGQAFWPLCRLLALPEYLAKRGVGSSVMTCRLVVAGRLQSE